MKNSKAQTLDIFPYLDLINPEMTDLLKKIGKLSKKQDIVIFEGWCVGVAPQKKNKDLIVPINELEKKKIKKSLEK